MQVKCSFCGGVQTKNSSSSCSCCGYFIELEFASDYYKSSLKGELGNLFAIAETALEARNWQEAIHYFNRILEKDIANPDAWFGKAVGVVNTSSLANFKFNQAIAYWENALSMPPIP